MALSQVRADAPLRVSPQPVRVAVWAVVLAWLARRLWRLLVLIARCPAALLGLSVVVVGIVAWQVLGLALLLGILGTVLLVLLGWRLRWPDGFHRGVSGPVRGWLRGGWVYRRRWTTAMDTAGLTVTRNGTTYVPPLLRARSTSSVDRVTVRMIPGQTLEDYAAVSDRLAQTFGTTDCRTRSVPSKPHLVELWLLVCDPLTALVNPFPADRAGLDAGLPVARAEDGSTWRLRIVGNHILIVGATGAGKGSVLWSIVTGLTPSIANGVVKVWAVDPKGGMELAPGRHLFDRFAHGDSTDQAGYEAGFADILEDAVGVMRSRQDRLRGITRLHTPSTDEPLIVVIVDELAALTGWVADRTAKKRIESALGLLLSQGRAVGVVVIGAVQDPRKDVLPMRDLFPTRIALRLNEAEQVALVLGPGARNRGARCDLIPDSLPGVGYVTVEGIAEPVRVRFSHITDNTITTLGQPARVPALTVVKGGAAA
ncbi:FtsK/SpoIIIE domain-containing protein [Microlunatus panaciterrae]|uniref:S-DNA-T family DNA segregation ATPase FtsK/SpoIIIE n=1 Tax=Microlunatus panaciterrae TaxID=400768 RepID=A0ABS2RFG9_9ACTN|nr:FtsK/SpoIIIE domain-containing protein [Microlunatus panaciterrae]MBM7797743.1 S-DNA-T family DNA segregation ATPase FtsK/SpoIIIE [Microlunatus panaciterrae]